MEPIAAEQNEILFFENFNDGFAVTGEKARWFYFASGAFVANDGVVTTSQDGLQVSAPRKNPATNEPAFTLSYGHESQNGGIPGGLDHSKWLALSAHKSSKGIPGFDVVPGTELIFEAIVSVQTFGTENHPFGDNVSDDEIDLRLACGAMNAMDMETMMVFDFLITNKTIYALYERLPFAKQQLGNYAAFTFGIPVASRVPEQKHFLQIAHNADAGIVRWLIDGKEVFSVNKIGYRLDKKYMMLNHGGEEQLVKPTQLAGGMGMFTLLDGHYPGDKGLVKLSEVPDTYFSPVAMDSKTPQTFFDNESKLENRLFGQGVSVQIEQYKVTRKILVRAE